VVLHVGSQYAATVLVAPAWILSCSKHNEAGMHDMDELSVTGYPNVEMVGQSFGEGPAILMLEGETRPKPPYSKSCSAKYAFQSLPFGTF
jgi:hypothetical protein